MKAMILSEVGGSCPAHRVPQPTAAKALPRSQSSIPAAGKRLSGVVCIERRPAPVVKAVRPVKNVAEGAALLLRSLR